MKLVVLIGQEQSVINKIKGLIPQEYNLLEMYSKSEAMQVLRNTSTGIVLVDMALYGALSWVEEAYSLKPDLTYIGVADNEEFAETAAAVCYDLLTPPFTSSKLKLLLERAWERSQLLCELRSHKEKPASNGAFIPAGNNSSLPGLKEQVLCEFSRSLGNNFNRDRLLELFMDAVTELVPVGKISILLLQEESGNIYSVYAQKGLDPNFCGRLKFNSSHGLIYWLLKQERILLFSAESKTTAGEALQEMELLQASVSIPLSAYGQLVGALNLGPKVTGSLFYEEELEVLYSLCGNLAMALCDIDLHHQVRYQKSYIESILQRMISGVVAINTRDEITTFNVRAGEILSLKQEEVLGKDLRILPSPLGDYLYETLATGKSYHKEEIELPLWKLPLEVSTYRLTNGKEEFIGSVMIFDDISQRKQLEAERRRSDKMEVLNKFVGQLAHEIKNPMVAIQTFSELLQDKYDESTFRDFYTHTVRQELKRLNELVEKLIAFSAPLTYKFTSVDIHKIIETGIMLLQDQGKIEKVEVATEFYEEPISVKGDKTILARAFSYLLSELVQALDTKETLCIKTTLDNSFPGGENVCIFLKDGQKKREDLSEEEMFKYFDPLSIKENDYIPLGLPVSRKIIEDHGGSIKASLTRERHFQFEITMPVFTGERSELDE